MQIRRKLTVALAAMIVAGQINGTASVAAPTADQISVLQAHLAAGDVDAFVAFVQATPDLLQDDTPLASVLRQFLMMYAGGQLAAFRPESLAEMEMALRAAGGQFQSAAVRPEIY